MMHRREDETLEGNYATDFSPYVTQVAWPDHFFIGLRKCHFLFYHIPRRFPKRSEARMPHVFNAASPPQFSRSPSPFMSPFGAHYPPMMPPTPAPPGPSELSSDPSPNSEESKRTRAD